MAKKSGSGSTPSIGPMPRVGMSVGWRFNPSDEFLVKLLHRLASGLSVNLAPHIVDADLYGPGKEPWNVFSGDRDVSELFVVTDPEKKVREKYVFTPISRIGAQNVSRTAGAGTWLDKSRAKDVEVDGYVMGRQRTLTYEYCGGDGGAAGKCFYSLHEYQLSDEALRKLKIYSFDYAVCRVLKDTSKPCRVGKKRKFDHCPLPLPKRSRQKFVELDDDDEAGGLDVGQIDHVDSERAPSGPELIDDFDLPSLCEEEDWKHLAALLDCDDQGSNMAEKAGPLVQEKEGEAVPEVIDLADEGIEDSDLEDDSNLLERFYQNTEADWKYLTEVPMDSDKEPELASVFPDISRIWEGLLSDDGVESF